MEEQSRQWDEAASLKWKAAAWRLGGAFLTFLAFVWVWGALTEAGWLAIRIADDVRRMREAAPQPREAAAPRAPLPDETQPEVRMPIRESPLMHREIRPSP